MNGSACPSVEELVGAANRILDATPVEEVDDLNDVELIALTFPGWTMRRWSTRIGHRSAALLHHDTEGWWLVISNVRHGLLAGRGVVRRQQFSYRHHPHLDNEFLVGTDAEVLGHLMRTNPVSAWSILPQWVAENMGTLTPDGKVQGRLLLNGIEGERLVHALSPRRGQGN